MALFLEDATSNNNDFTNVNGVTEVTSSLPITDSTAAADFESGSSQYLSIADASQTGLDLSGDFTIEFWVKFESLPSDGSSMVLVNKRDADSSPEGYIIQLNNNAGTYSLGALISETANDTTRDYVTATVTPSTGVWYHYAISCDISEATATTFTFYVNGSSIGNGSAVISGNCASIYNNDRAFLIGARENNGSFDLFMDGQMDDIRVWNVVRSSTNISDNYQKELVGNETGLVAYWAFEDTISSTSPSVSISPSISPSVSPSVSASPSISPSVSPSVSSSPSISPSVSPSDSQSPSSSPSVSVSPSVSPSASQSPSTSPSSSFSPSVSPSVSISPSPSPSPSPAQGAPVMPTIVPSVSIPQFAVELEDRRVKSNRVY